MPVDANIPLSVQTPQPVDPLAAYGRVMQLKSAMGQQQLQQAQLTGVNQENQQRGIQMQQMQQLNDAYKGSLNPDGTIDTGKLSGALAAGGAGSKIPEILKGVTDYQQSVANLGKTRLQVQNLQADAAGDLGNTLQKANYDPQLFLTKMQLAVNTKAATPQEAAPQIQQVQQALMQDPTGASARAIVKKIADAAVDGSQKWQTIRAQQQTAQGAADRGTAALASEQDRQSQQDLKDASSKLSNAKTQTDYALAYGDLPIKMADKFPDPSNFDPKNTPQAVLRVGMTPPEIAADSRNTNTQQNTEAYRQAMLAQGAQRIAQGDQRIGISQQNADTSTDRANKPTANAQGVDARFQTKEIDNARKQLDVIHQQRTAFGEALTTANDQPYMDPLTKKIVPEMNDDLRSQLQQQMQNVTNQGQRIMQQYGGQKSGNRIGQNEFGGQAPAAQNQQASGAAAKPAGQTIAPEGTITINRATGQRLQKVNGQWKPINN